MDAVGFCLRLGATLSFAGEKPRHKRQKTRPSTNSRPEAEARNQGVVHCWSSSDFFLFLFFGNLKATTNYTLITSESFVSDQRTTVPDHTSRP